MKKSLSAAEQIACFIWSNEGLDADETMWSMDQNEFIEMVDQIIRGKGPSWLKNIKKD